MAITKKQLEIAHTRMRLAQRRLKTQEDLFDDNPCEEYLYPLEAAERDFQKKKNEYDKKKAEYEKLTRRK